MTTITLGPIGEVPLGAPSSFAAIADLNAAGLGEGVGRVEVVRTRAAAIGILCKVKGMPTYRVARGDVLGYGGAVLDFLMSEGVTLGKVVDAGVVAFDHAMGLLPTEPEVAALEDFSSAGEGVGSE